MDDLEIILAAPFVSVAVLNAIARWMSVPYSIALVLGGLVLGWMSTVPSGGPRGSARR